ncbi:MAG: HNH endonuclease [bacterium JZ-2024 1]
MPRIGKGKGRGSVSRAGRALFFEEVNPATRLTTRSLLETRIGDFLPTLRVGLDLGEWTGGIAVVRGNQILHAETYTDYHATTLEERRRMRRGRRTRHARKMRLARLRSWILRKKLPDGTRLPDPYDLMRRKRFQHPPPQLPREKSNASQAYFDKSLHNFTSPWSYAVIRKIRTDPDAFVVALTHIFRKRGYKYDQRGLRDLQPPEMLEFLKSCFNLSEAPELKGQLKAYIRRLREEEQATPGKKEKRAYADDLDKALKEAEKRNPEPRKAWPRELKENEILRLVSAFGEAHQIPENTIDRWQKELVRLLNKIMREPRFDNRIVAGCTWCGKNTPRKSRKGVRELAFRAAVANLRKSRTLPLTHDEQREFLDKFDDPSFKKKPLSSRRTDFERLLSRYDAQVDMASQLAELCGSDAPPGRTSLCLQHLKKQSERTFPTNPNPGSTQEPTDLETVGGLGPSERLARNPCRQAHEERVVRRLEEILFTSDGSPRFGDIPSLITIEFPKPNTAHTHICPTEGCNQKLAIDLKASFKIRGPIRVLEQREGQDDTPFRCPACNAPLALQGKRMNFRTRKWDKYMLKRQDADIRKAKGGMKDKKRLEYLRETNYTCVYCERAIADPSGMEPDHIFPRSRGGPDVDYNLIASCHECNTSKGDRTPYEWKGNDPHWWAQFEGRLRSLPLPRRKRDILLSQAPSYPDNPTGLARATARKRAFIARIKKMLISHGVPPDQVANNYERNKRVVIQAVDGWITSRLRLSWRFDSEGRENFPEKNDRDLYNHAQDAALIAASPPHTWREQIFVEERQPVNDKDKPRRGLAPVSLAPDWRTYIQTYHNQKPLVTVLGNYRVSWKNKFLDTTFWRHPLQGMPASSRQKTRAQTHQLRTENRTASSLRPVQRKLVHELTRSQGERILDERIRGKFEELCKRYNIGKRKTLPPEALEELRSQFPGIRRVQVITQEGGYSVIIRPKDGPARKTQVKPSSEGVALWRKGSRSGISIIRPGTLRDRVPSRPSHPYPAFPSDFLLDPPLPDAADAVLCLFRNQFIYLDQHRNFPEGWYRLKEFSKRTGVILLHESRIPAELAERMGIETEGEADSEGDDRPSGSDSRRSKKEDPQERKLSKSALINLLKAYHNGKLKIYPPPGGARL